MAYLICGLGQAGCAIADEMFADENLARVAVPLAVNSTLKDLQSLRNIPRANWLGLSDVRGVIPGTTVGFEELVVGGFGKNPRRAHEVLSKNLAGVTAFFRDFAASHTTSENLATKEVQKTREGEEWTMTESNVGSVPFAMLILGLGGGTGCGSASIIAQAIREASAANTSIVVVGVLPATHEAAGEGPHGSYRQAWNALWALNELKNHVDGFILVDNERLAFSKNVELLFPSFNQYVAHALNDLILGHLLERIDPKRFERLSLPVIDIADIVSAISFDAGGGRRRPGYASFGWAANTTKGLAGYFLPGLGNRSVDLAALFQLSRRKQSLHDTRPEEARKNLGLVRLPIRLAHNKKVFPQTSLVETELGKLTSLNETHFGITLGRKPLVSVNTLFTFEFQQLSRIKQLQELATRYSSKGVREL